jgi:hypothetical protein
MARSGDYYKQIADIFDKFLSGGGLLPKYQWTSTLSDKNGGWNTMTVELLGIAAGANTCTPHLGPIGFKNGTHPKYIDSQDFRKDNEKGFRQCFKAIADLTVTNIDVVVFAQEKLVGMLRDIGEARAAYRMEDEWTGLKEGRYPIAFSQGPGGR